MGKRKDENIDLSEMINKLNRGGKNLQGSEINNILQNYEEKQVKNKRKMSMGKKLLIILPIVVGILAIPVTLIIRNALKKEYLYTYIDFNIEGAEDIKIQVEKGFKLSEIKVKNVEGYRFDGWFLDKEYKARLNDNTKISEEITIYGRYIRVYNVTLYFRSQPMTVEVDEGSTIREAINKFNIDNTIYKCKGIYTDSSYTNSVNIDDVLADDCIVYGNYVKELNVKVYLDGELTTVKADESSKISDIVTKFTIGKTGYVFQGWYTDNSYKIKANMTQVIQNNCTIYGRHAKIVTINTNIDGVQSTITSNEHDILDDIDKEIGSNYNNNCGWFKDIGLTQAVDKFNEDMTIYTKSATLDKLQFTELSQGAYQVSAKDNITGKVIIPRTFNNILITNMYFGNSNINEIVFSSGLKTISDSAFEYCKNLTTIVLPTNIKIISQYAFSYCSKLSNITIPNSVTSLGKGAFMSCEDLQTISLPQSVTTLMSEIFMNCKNLETIVLPSTLKEMGSSIFNGCTNLQSINLQDTQLTKIESYAFYNCINLSVVTLPSKIKVVGTYAFYGCDNLTMVDLTKCTLLTIIDNGAFGYCKNLINISIPSSVVEINNSAFTECHYLQNVTIPSGITKLGEYSFYNCNSLTELDLSKCTKLTAIGKETFNNCNSLSKVMLSPTITSIGENAFLVCCSLVEVYNLSGLDIKLGSEAHGYIACYAKVIHSSLSSASRLTTIDNVIYYVESENSYIAIAPTNRVDVTSITLDDKTTAICDRAFSAYYNLVEVKLPEGLINIGFDAFYKCNNLSTINIPSSIKILGYSSFLGCTSLTSMDLSKCTNLTNIQTKMFQDCTNLESVILPSSITKISKEVFTGCDKLKSITIQGEGVWYRTTSISYTNGIVTDVSNENTNVTHFISTYPTYYWYRKNS